MAKFTKIVATLGPSTDSVEKIQRLHKAGMSVARLNFSHGTEEYFEKLIAKIREVSEDIAIMLDTKGPEIRSGEVENNCILLEDDQEIILTNKEIIGTKKKLTINYKFLHNLSKGNLILIDDGLIEIQIIKKKDKELIGKVLNGGLLASKKTVTIKGHSVELPFLSSKDKKDIEFGVKHNVDFVAASFVRKESEIREFKAYLNKFKSEIKIISKIEHEEAVNNIDGIILESDGIMVARGDLGVEVELERVPFIQTEIIKKCNNAGKPVIVATQMLESMRSNPRPTRAEVADVSVAIKQGTDAVMLSGETASGKYPVKAVEMMARIAKYYNDKVTTNINEDILSLKNTRNGAVSLYIAKSAYDASNYVKSKAILTPTETGFTARNVSRFKPNCPIYAITPNKTILRQLQLSWGVFPILDEKNMEYEDQDSMVNLLVDKIYHKGFISQNDLLVVTSGHIPSRAGYTNMLEIYKTSQILERIKENKKK